MNDFTNFDPGSLAFNFSINPESLRKNAERMAELKAKMEAVERMRAATCKCGHVGAECFNDEYCNDPLETVEYWASQYKSLVARVENIESELLETINDLQADYAADIQAWRNVYQTNEEINDETYNEQAEQISDLETTVKVLSGLLSNI